MKKLPLTEEINSLSHTNPHFFAAANSYLGFQSFFDDCFVRDDINNLYILKGGPGVGKSTLMKKCAHRASLLGMSPIFYHCSSDPSSLDGVIIPEKSCAIIDGTAPHSFEPKLPGTRDICVDLGKAWKIEELSNRSKEIKELSEKKKLSYDSAYHMLKSAKSIYDELQTYIMHFVNHDKIKAAALRLVNKCFKKPCLTNASSNIKKSLVNAISCDGEIRFFTYEKLADTLIFIKDCKNTAGIFLKQLYNFAVMCTTDIYVCVCPEDHSKICGLFFPKEKISISIYDDSFCRNLEMQAIAYKVINMSRFVDTDKVKDCRAKYRFAEKCLNMLTEKAYNHLAIAGSFHKSLEKIYGQFTDYSVVEEISDEVLNKIFK